jgi:hypothetical protein
MCFAEFSGRRFAKSGKPGFSISTISRVLKAALASLRGTRGTRNAARVEGDYVLQDLGLQPEESSFSSSRGNLITMLVAHSAMALLGLLFTHHD